MTGSFKLDFNLIRAMEVFVAVAETRQVTRAARLLGVTQSAASQQLRNLEDALQAPLFDRASRPLELTRAGISLHRRAGRILNEIEDLRSDLRRLEAFPTPILRIGMLASIATTLTEPLVTLAKDRFGIPEVVLHAGLASDHQSLLRSRNADLVVTSDALYDLDGLERHTVLRESFLLVLPADYEGPSDDLACLAQDLPLVRFVVEAAVGRLTDQHLRRVRLELPRTIEADRSSMVNCQRGRRARLCHPDTEPAARRLRRVHGDQGAGPLPIPGFSRGITVLARQGELGELPAIVGQEVGDTLVEAIERGIPDLPPDTLQRSGPTAQAPNEDH